METPARQKTERERERQREYVLCFKSVVCAARWRARVCNGLFPPSNESKAAKFLTRPFAHFNELAEEGKGSFRVDDGIGRCSGLVQLVLSRLMFIYVQGGDSTLEMALDRNGDVFWLKLSRLERLLLKWRGLFPCDKAAWPYLDFISLP